MLALRGDACNSCIDLKNWLAANLGNLPLVPPQKAVLVSMPPHVLNYMIIIKSPRREQAELVTRRMSLFDTQQACAFAGLLISRDYYFPDFPGLLIPRDY